MFGLIPSRQEIYDALHPSEWRECWEVRERVLDNRGLERYDLRRMWQASLGPLHTGIEDLVIGGYAEKSSRMISLQKQWSAGKRTPFVAVYRRTEKEIPQEGKEQSYFRNLQPAGA